MKRLIIVLLMAFLISSPIASSQIENSVNRQKTPAPLEEAVKSKFLFFQLPALASVEGIQKIEFRIRVDGLPYLVEQISLSPDEAHQNPTIELLSREHARLKKLYRLAKKGAHQVEVTVMLNGQIAKEFSFDELLSYNRDLKQHLSFRPIPVESRVIMMGHAQNKIKGPSGVMQAASSCEQECNDSYAACAEAYCGSPTVFCGPCLEDRDTCLNACPPDSECPVTTCSTETQPIGSSYQGQYCLTKKYFQENGVQENRMFDRYIFYYKVTKTCRTVDSCKGTESTTTTYEYFNWPCDYEIYYLGPCENPRGLESQCVYGP